MDKEARLKDLAAGLGEGLLGTEDSGGMPVLVIRPDALLPLVRSLREPPFGLDVLLDLTCRDGPDTPQRFTLVYHFASFASGGRVRVNIPLQAEDPVADSLTPFWPNADWLEREVFDMFGVRFRGHPRLTRILLYEGFEGHPLRKDYPFRKRQPLVPEADKP